MTNLQVIDVPPGSPSMIYKDRYFLSDMGNLEIVNKLVSWLVERGSQADTLMIKLGKALSW